jgi:hypothetical protein
MKIKRSKKITKLMMFDEQMYDWNKIVDFSIYYGDRAENINFSDAFDVGASSVAYFCDFENAPPLSIYQVNGKYGIYFFLGSESHIIKKINKFVK